PPHEARHHVSSLKDSCCGASSPRGRVCRAAIRDAAHPGPVRMNRLGSETELAAEAVPEAGELATEDGDGADDRDGDAGDDERVLRGGGALLLAVGGEGGQEAEDLQHGFLL